MSKSEYKRDRIFRIFEVDDMIRKILLYLEDEKLEKMDKEEIQSNYREHEEIVEDYLLNIREFMPEITEKTNRKPESIMEILKNLYLDLGYCANRALLNFMEFKATQKTERPNTLDLKNLVSDLSESGKTDRNTGGKKSQTEPDLEIIEEK